MRLAALFFVVLGTAILSADPAEARRGGYSSGQELSFIQEVPDTGMSLCHLVDFRRVIGMPITKSASAYVMSETNCTGDTYIPLNEQQFLAMQSAGLIDAALPREAALTSEQMRTTYGVWGLLGFLALMIAIETRRKGRSGANNRGPKPIRVSRGARNSTMAAMCSVARADGEVDRSEAQTIFSIAKSLMGKAPDPKKIARMMDDAPASVAETNFDAFAEGLKPAERHVVMRAALMVAVADGQIHNAEHDFISRLAESLQVHGDDVRGMLRDIAPGMQTA